MDKAIEGAGAKGRRILVTGVGGSIGSAIIAQLEDDGAELVKISQNGLADEGIVVEFRDDRALGTAVANVPGTLDGIVLSHGIARGGKIDEITGDDFRTVLDVNLVSLFVILRSALPKLSKGASVVVISSTAAFDHSPVCGLHYTASKWALNGIVRHLAFEWGQREIRINSVCPGYVDNPMGRAFLPESEVAASLPHIALGREAHPSEVADLVAYLLSPKSSYITGALIPVSGGFQ